MISREFALGIPENIGGRVKTVKKVKCYNVDPGEPRSGIREREVRESDLKDAFMSSIRSLTSARCNFLTVERFNPFGTHHPGDPSTPVGDVLLHDSG
jgi:hypothetical protein